MRMSEYAAGFDAFARLEDDVVILPRSWAKVPLGFSIEVPMGFEAQVRPRSGNALKFGIFLLNSPGTVDSDYRGEVCAIVANFSNEDFHVANGDRIAQMVICPVPQVELICTEELTPTDRDAGGFGSSGLR